MYNVGLGTVSAITIPGAPPEDTPDAPPDAGAPTGAAAGAPLGTPGGPPLGAPAAVLLVLAAMAAQARLEGGGGVLEVEKKSCDAKGAKNKRKAPIIRG